MIKRYVSLQQVFEKNRYQVFKSYGDSGGEYMGEEERRSGTPTKSPVEEFDEDFDWLILDSIRLTCIISIGVVWLNLYYQ